MATTKLFDAVVKTGEYTNGQGETKGRYENIGSIMQGDSGMFMILKRTFNAAGVPNPDCKDSVIVSFFEQQQQQNNQQGQQQNSQQGGFQSQQQAPQQQQNQQQQNGGFQQQNGGYQNQ